MRNRGNSIKIGILLVLVVGLYSFSNIRHKNKKVTGVQIEFVGDQNLYINHEMVNKLLILNYGDLAKLPKENIVLNTIEKTIEANEMVQKAQVFLPMDGELVVRIAQRKPIGRIEGASRFYIDETGERMPFSQLHSARVPIITGKITENTLRDVYKIITYGNSDEFLQKNIIGIRVKEEGAYQLQFRTGSFVVELGDAEELESKFSNFRAFYIKANRDNTLGNYNTVSLEFNNQVVCTKI